MAITIPGKYRYATVYAVNDGVSPQLRQLHLQRPDDTYYPQNGWMAVELDAPVKSLVFGGERRVWRGPGTWRQFLERTTPHYGDMVHAWCCAWALNRSWGFVPRLPGPGPQGRLWTGMNSLVVWNAAGVIGATHYHSVIHNRRLAGRTESRIRLHGKWYQVQWATLEEAELVLAELRLAGEQEQQVDLTF